MLENGAGLARSTFAEEVASTCACPDATPRLGEAIWRAPADHTHRRDTRKVAWYPDAASTESE